MRAFLFRRKGRKSNKWIGEWIEGWQITDSEKAVMRALGAKYVSKDKEMDSPIILWKNEPHAIHGWFVGGGGYICEATESMFPSLHRGYLIQLEEQD